MMSDPDMEKIDQGWVAPPPLKGEASAASPRRPGRPKGSKNQLPLPVYDEDGITLYHGDNKRLMPLLKAQWDARGMAPDHVITDPPYSARVQANSRAPKLGGGFTGRTERVFRFPPMNKAWMKDLKPFFQLARRWLLVFTDDKINQDWRDVLDPTWRREDGKPKRGDWCHVCQMVYWKDHGAPQLSGDRPAQWQEFIEVFHRKQKMRWNGHGKPGRYDHRPESWTENKGVKPLALMREIITDFCEAGELVFDPFAGLGTTLLACKERGVRAVGIEGDEACIETAIRRLRQGILPTLAPTPSSTLKRAQYKIDFGDEEPATPWA